MKTCKKCRASLPESEYYCYGGNAYSTCKACVRERVRLYGKTERGRAVERKRNKKPARKAKIRERVIAWRDANQDGYRAHSAVSNAVRSGRLVKPSCCDECGATDRAIHAHHHDYSAPLDVTWLCVVCHKAAHIGRPQLSLFGLTETP